MFAVTEIYKEIDNNFDKIYYHYVDLYENFEKEYGNKSYEEIDFNKYSSIPEIDCREEFLQSLKKCHENWKSLEKHIKTIILYEFNLNKEKMKNYIEETLKKHPNSKVVFDVNGNIDHFLSSENEKIESLFGECSRCHHNKDKNQICKKIEKELDRIFEYYLHKQFYLFYKPTFKNFFSPVQDTIDYYIKMFNVNLTEKITKCMEIYSRYDIVYPNYNSDGSLDHIRVIDHEKDDLILTFDGDDIIIEEY